MLVLACANHIAAAADDQLTCTHLHMLHIAIEMIAVALVVVLYRPTRTPLWTHYGPPMDPL